MQEHRLFHEKLHPPMSKIMDASHSIEAELVLGMLSRNCGGSGICKMYPKHSIGLEKAYTHYTEVCFYLDVRDQLHLVFDRKSMRLQTFRKHFSDGFFRVDEDVELAPFICTALEKQQIIIKEGAYKVTPIYRYILLTLNDLCFYSIKKQILKLNK